MQANSQGAMDGLSKMAASGLSLFATLFIALVGILTLLAIVFFIIDITQTKDTVRRNYPVLGRFSAFFL